MRVWSGVCAVVSWLCFVFTTCIHGIMMFVLWMPPAFSEWLDRNRAENAVNAKALPFMVAGFLLFAVGSVLFRYLHRRKWAMFAVSLVGTLLLAGVGLYLKVKYPATIVTGGAEVGYNSAFKLAWRHMMPLITLVLQVLAVVFHNKADERRIRKEAVEDMADYKPRFE